MKNRRLRTLIVVIIIIIILSFLSCKPKPKPYYVCDLKIEDTYINGDKDIFEYQDTNYTFTNTKFRTFLSDGIFSKTLASNKNQFFK
jgi:hypothetical protein